MTDKSVSGADVGGDVLGKVARIFSDIVRNIENGGIDPDRAHHLMGLAAQGDLKKPWRGPATIGRYMLEFQWTYDDTHVEYATREIEACEAVGYECLVEAAASPEVKQELLRELEKLLEGPTFDSFGTRKMLRLYRVLRCSRFGRRSTTDGVTTRTCDLHFTMVPICDFDENGQPIPPKEENDKF